MDSTGGNLTKQAECNMTIAELIKILKTHDQNAIVVLLDYGCETKQSGVARLQADEIRPVELYQVEHKGISWYELDDGARPPVANKGTVVFDKRVMAVLLGAL
jgi:arginine repressor